MAVRHIQSPDLYARSIGANASLRVAVPYRARHDLYRRNGGGRSRHGSNAHVFAAIFESDIVFSYCL